MISYDTMQRQADITDAVLTSLISARQGLLSTIDYQSRTWKNISWAIKVRDRFRCRRCGITVRLVVHHIIPIGKGGTNLPQNLLTVCDVCHRLAHKEFGKRRYV
jgi:hypothetical protein